MFQLSQDIAPGRVDAIVTQVRAAIAAALAKVGERGKQDAKADAGKFAPALAPRLIISNRKLEVGWRTTMRKHLLKSLTPRIRKSLCWPR
jgi:hypothetical protein